MINKIHIPLFLFLLLFSSCKEDKPKNNTDVTNADQIQDVRREAQNDTIIAHEQEGAGSKVTVYFPIVRKDTVSFEVSFADIGNSPLSTKIYFQKRLTYKEHYSFLKLILKKASEDFKISKLNLMYLGTLPNTGDLAIHVTQQLLQEDTNLEASLRNYEMVSDILMQTKITSDFDMLLKPYGLKVDGYNLEKVSLANSTAVFKDMKLETPAEDIPEKVLDAIVWVSIGETETK